MTRSAYLVIKVFCIVAFFGLCSCSTAKHPPLPLAQNVDLDRFMGDWYVIAVIPTFIEEDAYNSLESYELNEDGTIATTFTFNEGSFDGPLKKYTPKGFVVEGTGNAVWRMRFFWPFKTDYRIAYLNEDYSITIIGRQKRDYVWLMARKPEISQEKYAEMIALISGYGYDVQKVRKIPHEN